MMSRISADQRPAAITGAVAIALFVLGVVCIPLGYLIGDVIGPVVMLFMLAIPMLWVAALVFGALAVLRALNVGKVSA